MIHHSIGLAGFLGYGKLRRYLLFLVLLAVTPLMAQVDNVYVYGSVKDYSTSKRLDGVTVSVLKDGVKSNAVVTSANGKYEFNLDYGYEYKIVFDKPGMVGKNVVIDTKGIPDEERVGGIAMNVEMTLIQEIPGIDYSILLEPFGKSRYDGGEGMLSWDLAYTEQMRAAQNRLMKEYDEKRKKEANADVAFKKLMDQGNAAMTAKDYRKAVGNFTGALELKPDDPIATARLSDAQIRLGEQEQAEQKEKQYTDLIKEADGLFSKKGYEDAKSKYQAALAVKEGEKYPAQRIKECDAFLADLAAKAEQDRKAKELDEAYQAAVAAGDAAFKTANYSEARTKYTEAAGLKPAEKYPPQQLAAIVAKEEESARKAEEDRKAKELEDAYQAAIKGADDAFNKADYETARTGYNQALGLKPKEKYPPQQLAAIDKKLDELAKQAEEERKAAEQEAAYQAVIAAADGALQQENFDEAKKKYNEALGLKPKEKYPADQLTLIAKQVAEKAKQAEEERLAAERDALYQGFVDQGEQLFKAEKYNEAKAQYQEAQKVKPGEPLPKERIVEIEAKLEQLVREAELARKQAELDAQYTVLVAGADKKFDARKLAEALNDYKNALALKPDEAHPAQRIAAINEQLDAVAREQAEKERLAQEQADKDKRYGDLIKQADKDFKSRSYTAATDGYTAALDVKPGEEHPTNRLAEIRQLLETQAAAEREREALDAAERARVEEEARLKAEADSLKAAREAEEKARLEAERRAREQSETERQASYDNAIAMADAAFRNKAWDMAREGYNEALAVKPKEKYPKDQLEAITKAMADQQRAEQEALAKAEADRLAREQQTQREAEQADALEQARRAREAQRALDERYEAVVLDADKAMGEKDYAYARELYGQALDIKPNETYPQLKMDQIGKLMADAENQRRQREEMERKKKTAPPPVVHASNMDNRKEQEAEEFMREAREREEAEKYGRIKRLKSREEQVAEERGGKAEDRHREATRGKADLEGNIQELYQGSEALRMRNLEEVAALKEAVERNLEQWGRQGEEASGQARAEAENQQAEIRQRHTSLAQGRTAGELEVEQQQQEWQAYQIGLAEAARERSDRARREVLDVEDAKAADERRQGASAELKQRDMEGRKEAWEARQNMVSTAARERQMGNEAGLSEITPNRQRSFDNYARSELASQYPQGVTEESYTEGNKVIIRRVLVQGNKADEYSKVIAKWGTFYFKNGQSITEHIWTVNTER